jgi:hypothetical protein
MLPLLVFPAYPQFGLPVKFIVKFLERERNISLATEDMRLGGFFVVYKVIYLVNVSRSHLYPQNVADKTFNSGIQKGLLVIDWQKINRNVLVHRIVPSFLKPLSLNRPRRLKGTIRIDLLKDVLFKHLQNILLLPFIKNSPYKGTLLTIAFSPNIDHPSISVQKSHHRSLEVFPVVLTFRKLWLLFGRHKNL